MHDSQTVAAAVSVRFTAIVAAEQDARRDYRRYDKDTAEYQCAHLLFSHQVTDLRCSRYLLLSKEL